MPQSVSNFQVLVMAPTRELAKQVSDTFETFASSDLSVLSVYGGTPIFPQGRCLMPSYGVMLSGKPTLPDVVSVIHHQLYATHFL